VSGPLEANSSLAPRSARLQGLGLARIPWFVVGEDLAAGRLVQVLPGWELPAQEIHALTTSRGHLPRKPRALVEFFRGRPGSPPCRERGLAAAL
jgi:DNA-binding transcriptional LysR family regulator